ncbi:peptidase inhibitor family I36 protein, partial [Sphaerisporangium sp. NPDC049002]
MTRRTRIAATTGMIGFMVVALATPAPEAVASSGVPSKASAGAQGAPENRGPGDICLWAGRDYTGASWCWNPGNGYVDVPSALHDNVGSFQADADGCFINWIHVPDKKETRVVRKGDYRQV